MKMKHTLVIAAAVFLGNTGLVWAQAYRIPADAAQMTPRANPPAHDANKGAVYVSSVHSNALRYCTPADVCSTVGSGGANYNQTVEDEGVPLTQRTSLNFTGAGVTCADGGSKTTCTIPGGGGGGTVTSLTCTAPAVCTPSPITGVGVISHSAAGTEGSYGSATAVPVITTNATGHVTGVVATTIALAQSAITGLVADLAAKLPLAGGVMTGAITFSGTQTGTYTLGGTPTLGANMSIASGFDIVAAGGASDFDYSLSSGIFKTPTGVATFNGSGNDFTAIVRSTMDAVASLGDSTRRWASGWFGTNAVGTTQLAAITAANNVAATVGAQKFSPMIELDGAGWKTDATAASRTVRAAMQVRPVQGTAAPESELVFWRSVDTGTPSWLEMFSVSEQFGDRDQIKSGRNKALFSASDDSGVYVDGAEPSVNLRTSGFVRAAMTPSAFRPGNDLSASLGDSTTAWANVYTRHIVGAGAAPTFTAGAGLGTAPTVTVTGTDIAYKIAITTGTSVPAGASTWGTLNYNTAYAVKPKAVMCMPGDVNAGAYWGTSGIYVDDATSSTTVNTLKVATTALNNTTDYILNCQVIQ